MDIQKEKDAFLNVFQFFKSFKGIGFNEETEQFFLKKNKPNDAECLDVSNLNQMWRAWWARAKSQAVPEGFVLVPVKDLKYFSNNGESYEVHDSLDEAKREAKCAIEHYEEMLADQQLDPACDGNFGQIGYGIILAESGYSIDHIVTQDDVNNGDYSYEAGTQIMSLHLNEVEIKVQEQSHD